MYQRREYKPGEKVSVNFRPEARLAEAIHAAAEKAKFDSTAKWLKFVTQTAAAKELGVTFESLEPEPERPKRGLTLRDASPEAAARLAQYNALMLDAQEKLKQANALLDAPVEAPTAPRRGRR